MDTDQKLSDPCKICLVRPCCSEGCHDLTDYIREVLDLVMVDSNHEVLKNFSEQQAELIRSTAETIKRNTETKNDFMSMY